VIESGVMNNQKHPNFKDEYSSYKKYTLPKGDPMVYNLYIYQFCGEMPPTVPVKK
jgi:hypothetical protein